MRWLSTLGLPWLFGKNDRRRTIFSSVNQKKLLLMPPQFGGLNRARKLASSRSMGPEPKSREARRRPTANQIGLEGDVQRRCADVVKSVRPGRARTHDVQLN
jgi:hypothetical protein